MEIVPEILSLREDMVKNPFFIFESFTSKNPCDSSPPSRQNLELETLEKFLKHGFSFLTPIYHFLSKPDPNVLMVS